MSSCLSAAGLERFARRLRVVLARDDADDLRKLLDKLAAAAEAKGTSLGAALESSRSILGCHPLELVCFPVTAQHVELLQVFDELGVRMPADSVLAQCALRHAWRAGEMEYVCSLLRLGVDVNMNVNDREGAVPKPLLVAAMLDGHLDVVQQLLTSDALDVGVHDRHGTSVVHRAMCLEDRGELAAQLVGRLPDGALFSSRLLLLASQEGADLAVAALLARGVPVDERGNLWETPLMCASESGHELVVRMLLDAGADASSTDRGYNSVMGYAARGGNVAIMEMLIAAGASVHGSQDSGTRCVEPLDLAVQRRCIAAMEFLLAAGVSPNLMGTHRDLLGKAAMGRSTEAVALLVQYGADVNGQSKRIAKFAAYKQTALHLAALYGCREMAEVLLAAGAEVEARDSKDCTPLAYAVQGNELETTKLLLEHNAQYMGITTSTGATLFEHAAGAPLVLQALSKQLHLDTFLPVVVEVHRTTSTASTSLQRFIRHSSFDWNVLREVADFSRAASSS